MDFGKAIRNEHNRRALAKRVREAPEGEGFSAFGANREQDQQTLEATDILAQMASRKVRRRLRPLQSTNYEEENDAE